MNYDKINSYLKHSRLPYDDEVKYLDGNYTKEHLIDALSLLVKRGYNINSLFQDGHPLFIEYDVTEESYREHIVDSVIEVTQIHNEYTENGYIVQAMEWDSEKGTAVFFVARREDL